MVTPGLPALPGRKERLLYPEVEEEREVRWNELRGDPGGECVRITVWLVEVVVVMVDVEELRIVERVPGLLPGRWRGW